jgi:hypothetical protein
MVALLWDAGHVLSAIDLEALWNELGLEVPFSLYCAYHSESVAGHEHADALAHVCRLHGSMVADDDVTGDFAAEPAAVAVARRLVTDALWRWGHEAAVLADAELVTSELVSNAILHAGTPFRVSVHRYGPVVRIGVRDAAKSLPVVMVADPARFTGRGMRLVSAAASRWGVDATADGKTVWAEFSR